MKTTNLFLAMAFGLIMCRATAQIEPSSFKNPEPQNHVVAWWHWLNGNITRQGITRDLEAMKAVGITQATVLNVWRDMPDADVPNKVRFDTPEWWDGRIGYLHPEESGVDNGSGLFNTFYEVLARASRVAGIIAQKEEYTSAKAAGQKNDWTQLYGECVTMYSWCYFELTRHQGDVPYGILHRGAFDVG